MKRKTFSVNPLSGGGSFREYCGLPDKLERRVDELRREGWPYVRTGYSPITCCEYVEYGARLGDAR